MGNVIPYIFILIFFIINKRLIKNIKFNCKKYYKFKIL